MGWPGGLFMEGNREKGWKEPFYLRLLVWKSGEVKEVSEKAALNVEDDQNSYDMGL